MLVMFSMISVQGIRMLLKVDFTDERNTLIVAISVGAGLGVSVYPPFSKHYRNRFSFSSEMES